MFKGCFSHTHNFQPNTWFVWWKIHWENSERKIHCYIGLECWFMTLLTENKKYLPWKRPTEINSRAQLSVWVGLRWMKKDIQRKEQCQVCFRFKSGTSDLCSSTSFSIYIRLFINKTKPKFRLKAVSKQN